MFLKDSFLIAYYTRFYLMKKIILLGYMGSGKSSVGVQLAKMLNERHLDLDQIIEKKENLSISEIFETKGELYFRKVEHLCFKELVESDESFVLSLGGGTPCYANNHLFLQGEHLFSFYLKTSIDALYMRLKDSKTVRPLLAEKEESELKEYIAKHLFDRSFYYHQANHIINTDNKSNTEVAAEIAYLLT